MKAKLVLFTLFALSIWGNASSETLLGQECQETQITQAAREQFARWDAVRNSPGGHEIIRNQILELQTNQRFSCLDLHMFRVFALQIDSWSSDPIRAIPALEKLLPIAKHSRTLNHRLLLLRLIAFYRENGQFEELVELHNAEIQNAPPKIAGILRRARIVGLIGLHRLDEAFAASETAIREHGGATNWVDFHLGIALATKLSKEESVQEFTDKAIAKFETYRAPSRMAGMNENLIDVIFARLTDVTYQYREIVYPKPSYPRQALVEGVSGQCTVIADTDKDGQVVTAKAFCSDRVFVRSAERAMLKAKFRPLVIDGEAQPWLGIEYPIDFNLN